MIRNLKVMGLALVAILAMSAVVASGASAQFESEAEETTLSISSSETQKFQVASGGLTVECSTLALDNAVQTGVESGGNFVATEVTVEPTYSGCANLLGQSTTVTTNGCDYVFHLADNATSGTTDVACPTSTGIQIKIGSICTYEVDSQKGLSSVAYTNKGEGSSREVEISPNVSGIVSSRTTNDFFCPAAGSEGTYKGNATIDGTVGIFVD